MVLERRGFDPLKPPLPPPLPTPADTGATITTATTAAAATTTTTTAATANMRWMTWWATSAGPYPVGLPSQKGELANRAVAMGCSASDVRNLRTMSSSLPKSRFT